MFHWFLGTAAAIALYTAIKRRRYVRYYYGGYQPRFPFGARRGLRGRGIMRGLFYRLETTPGQENAIIASLDEAFERLRGLKGDLGGTRREIGALVGSSTFDREAMQALITRHRSQLDAATDEALRTLERVHEVLDDSQRRELGALIAEGSLGPTMVRGYGYHHCGPGYAF